MDKTTFFVGDEEFFALKSSFNFYILYWVARSKTYPQFSVNRFLFCYDTIEECKESAERFVEKFLTKKDD